jgi:hypothetical protein
LAAGLVLVSVGFCLAQFRGGRGWRYWDDGASGPIVHTEGGEEVNEDTVKTARETARHSVELPDWTNAPGWDHDVFVFCRMIYKSRPGRPSFLGWVNDYPDGDLNLSCRLQQLTSMKSDADGRVLKLTDPAIADYPFVFMAQVGGLEFREPEVKALRTYLANGGALMVDDFWGARDWESFEGQMRRVLPGRAWTELTIEHPLFHCVFDLRGPVQNLQVPSIHRWRRSYDPDNPTSAASWYRGPGSQEMHVRAWLDDRQRVMVIATHNTDLGDGWEREGEDKTYFELFSETRAYPLAINILFYLMTH